jgi:3-isopropylmalate/(R)-2-methylmalate dehydratase small subunit
VTVDLDRREVRAEGVVASFELDDFTRWRLMEGLDDIGLTLRHDGDITDFEATRPSWKPTAQHV